MVAPTLTAGRWSRLAPDVLAVVEEGELAPPCGPGVAGLRAEASVRAIDEAGAFLRTELER